MSKGQIEITAPDIKTLKLSIQSMPGSSLIMNKFSDLAEKEIRRKQTGESAPVKKHKDIEEIFESKKYLTKDKKLGIPSVAIKAAMVAAAKVSGEAMTDMRKGFHVIGDIIPFKSHSEAKIREDCLTLPRGGRNFTVRCEVEKWSIDVAIFFNANFISPSQLANLLSLAGFHCGLLDFRPNGKKCSGSNGLFELVTEKVKGKKVK